MSQKPDTVSVEEFESLLDNININVLASHLILTEELCAIREEVYDPEKEARRFFTQRQEAGRLLLLESNRQRELLRAVLDRRKQNQSPTP
jgi:hypothetical protein